jgi:hypothetical protein
MIHTLSWSSGTAPSLAFDILKGTLFAFVASWLAVKSAVRQFSSQRWWERQEEAYRKIVENLSRIQVSLSLIDNSGVEFVSQEQRLRKWSQIMKTIDDLEQTYHEGAFRISVSSTQALNKLVSNWYRAAPPEEDSLQIDQIDRCRNAISECRAVIDREARKDLRLPPRR